MWHGWRAGNQWALNTLLAYNKEDVLNMEVLMETAYELMLEKTFADPEFYQKPGKNYAALEAELRTARSAS